MYTLAAATLAGNRDWLSAPTIHPPSLVFQKGFLSRPTLPVENMGEIGLSCAVLKTSVYVMIKPCLKPTARKATSRWPLYSRVSTRNNGQDTENQLHELRRYCRAQGWRIYDEYIDHASGKRGDREEFQRLFEDAHKRHFDQVLFWALDRFSREGVLETLKHLERLTHYGVGWKSYTEQYLDSAGIFKDAIISIMATLAKQERVKISERTIAGLERARAQGKRLGRPRKIFDRRKLVRLRKQGKSFSALAQEFNISRTQAHRVVKAAGL